MPSRVVTFVKDVLFFFIAIALCSILVLPLIICSIWRLIVWIWITVLQGNIISSFLSAQDLHFVSLERHTKFYLKPDKLLFAIIILDEKLNLTDFKGKVLKQITEKKDHTGNLIFQRLQQHIVKYMGYFVFKWDRNFNIHKHIKEIQADVTEENLMEFIKPHNDKPFPPDSPLWEIILVPNFNKFDGHTLLYLRIHHVICDGMSLLKMLKASNADDNEDISLDELELEKVENQRIKSSFCDHLRNFYSTTIGLPHSLYSKLFGNTYLENIDLTNKYFQAKTENIPLSKFKELKAETGISFTAAIASCVSSSLSVHLTRGQIFKENKDCLTTVIVLPKVQESVGNSFYAAYFNLPVKQMGLDNRALACQKELITAKSLKSPRLLEFFGKTGKILPYKLFKKLYLPDVSQENIIIITNMVGPKRIVRAFDKTTIDMCFALKCSWNTWLTVAILSYAGSVKIIFSGTTSAFQTQEILNQLVETFVSDLDILFSKTIQQV